MGRGLGPPAAAGRWTAEGGQQWCGEASRQV